LALPISHGLSPAAGTAGKSARADFAVEENFAEESARHWKQKNFWPRFLIDLITNNKFQPNSINDDPVANFESSQRTDHGRSDDSGNANDFLNEISSKSDSSYGTTHDRPDDSGNANNVLKEIPSEWESNGTKY
jgi:hypothetical protein